MIPRDSKRMRNKPFSDPDYSPEELDAIFEQFAALARKKHPAKRRRHIKQQVQAMTREHTFKPVRKTRKSK